MLTVADAAHALGVSTRRIRQMIEEGKLAAKKAGRDWVIQERALERVKDRKPGRPKK